VTQVSDQYHPSINLVSHKYHLSISLVSQDDVNQNLALVGWAQGLEAMHLAQDFVGGVSMASTEEESSTVTGWSSIAGEAYPGDVLPFSTF
jgi:hypothetical protein